MSKTELVGAGLLIISLCGCIETKTDNAPAGGGSGRSGAVGVTTQDIDDLGKPASKAPGGAGGVAP